MDYKTQANGTSSAIICRKVKLEAIRNRRKAGLGEERGRGVKIFRMAQFTLKQKHYAILNFAGVQIDPYTRGNPGQQERLRKMLCDGLYFFNNTLKYWVTDNGKDCFELYARKLRITGSDDPSYWIWYRDQQEPHIDVAESANVRWLEVQVRFSTVNLQQNTSYKVVFKVRANKPQILNIPLHVKLTLPDGSKQENPRPLTVTGEHELEAGTFRTSYNTVGTLDISLQQLDSSVKTGLAIVSVRIVAQD